MDERTGTEPWYSVRCVIRSAAIADVDGWTYEERVTVWRANSFEDAIERAELEANDYAADTGGEYVGFAQAFHLFAGDHIDDGAEVFSLMRDSTLSVDDYLTRFFDSGHEHEGTIE